jgi:hypothetical protein
MSFPMTHDVIPLNPVQPNKSRNWKIFSVHMSGGGGGGPSDYTIEIFLQLQLLMNGHAHEKKALRKSPLKHCA